MLGNNKNYKVFDEEDNSKENGNAEGNVTLTRYNPSADDTDLGLDNKAYDEEHNQHADSNDRVSESSNHTTITIPISNEVTYPSSFDPGSPPYKNKKISEILEDTVKRKFTKKNVHKRIPILQWLPTYDSSSAVSDLVAGFTVGLTVIPQAIAFSNIAGIPPQYGLYSSFLGCFVYTLLGSCKDAAMGPTAIMAILTRENTHGLGPPFVMFLTFMTGLVQMIMGALQLGFIIDFISGPVSAGFTSAAAIIIATSQMKDLLGLSYSASKFLDVWDQLTHNINNISKGDAILGLTCMVTLLVLRKIKDIPIGPSDTKERTQAQKILGQCLWFISTARNILVVVFCAILAFYFEVSNHDGSVPFKLSGDVQGGLPSIEVPPFELTNGTRTYNFFQMTSELMGSAILVIPLLSIMETISLAKVFSNGKSIDATQEMLASGVCNIMSSFVGSMPISGALSRGAVNNASGVKTTFGGVYTGIIVLVSLQYFTPYFKYIPKATLAAVIIAAVVFMVEFHVVKPMWRTKKIDLIPAAATFISCLLLRLEVGIVIGVSINVLFLLYASARPHVEVEKHKNENGYEYLTITPDRALVFPSVEYVRNLVSKAGLKHGYSSIPVVIDSTHIQGADFTAAKGISSLIGDFVRRNQELIFYNLKPSIVEMFQGVHPTQFHHFDNEQELHDFLKESYRKSMQQNNTNQKR